MNFVINRPRWSVFGFVLLLSMCLFFLRRHEMQWFEVHWTEEEGFTEEADDTKDSMVEPTPEDLPTVKDQANAQLSDPEMQTLLKETNSNSALLQQASEESSDQITDQTSPKRAIKKVKIPFTRGFPVSLLPLYNYIVNLDSFFSTSFGNFIFMNICFAVTLGIGFPVERLFFKGLRDNERSLVVERSMTFIFYHILFLFGIVSLTIFEDILFWCCWFLIFAFLQHFTLLTMERLKFMLTGQFSNGTSPNRSLERLSPYIRLCFLLIALLMVIFSLLFSVACSSSAAILPWNVKGFIGTFLLFLCLMNVHSLMKLTLHIKKGTTSNNLFTEDSSLYYAYLTIELATLGVNMAHYSLMIIWTQQLITLAGLVVLLHLRHIYYEILIRLRKHKNLVQLKQRIHDSFPLVKRNASTFNGDGEEDTTQTCTICWDELSISRRLPCKHEFHEVCLISWLMQDLSCPICRRSLLPELQQNNLRSSLQLNQNPVPFSTDVTQTTAPLSIVGSSNTRITIGLGLTSDNGINQSASHPAPIHSALRTEPNNGSSPPSESTSPSIGLQPNSTTYRFDGSRFCRWLPSFTVEIARFNAGNFISPEPFSHVDSHSQSGGLIESSLVAEDLQQLQDMFPHIPRQRLQNELWNFGGSLEDAIDNILENSVDFYGSGEDEEVNAPANFAPASSILTDRNEEEIIAASHSNDLLTNDFDTSSPTASSLPCFKADFSTSSSDREVSFKSRRDAMLLAARRRFLESQQSSSSSQVLSNT